MNFSHTVFEENNIVVNKFSRFYTFGGINLDKPFDQILIPGNHFADLRCQFKMDTDTNKGCWVLLECMVDSSSNYKSPTNVKLVVVTETNLDPDEIECVMSQTNASREKAEAALREYGNIVDAILDLIP